MHVCRCSPLLTRLRVVPIPQLNLVVFLRLPAHIALELVKLGGYALAPGVDLIAFVRGLLVLAPSAEGCEFRAVGRRYLAAQVAEKWAVGGDAGGDDAEVDFDD